MCVSSSVKFLKQIKFSGFTDYYWKNACDISYMYILFIVFYFQQKEREGDYLAAINLYMKAGLPARAARLATSRDVCSRSHYGHTDKLGC